MQEDLKKNFILLSQIAKEKKYAQEYMGLLARRGDIGSIRIGKRWYTTWAWFEEFLENSQKKKTENVCEVQIAQPEMRVQREEKIVEESASSRLVGGQAADKPAKIAVAVKTRREEMIPGRSAGVRMMEDVRGIRGIGKIGEIKIQPKILQAENILQGKIRQSFSRMETKFKNVFVEKKNVNPLPYKEIKFRKNKDVFSPVFGVGEEMHSIFFPKFVFATGFAIIFLLVAVSGYFVFSDGIFKKGTVAGASSERKGVFSGISSEGEYFLSNAGDKIKESLSVSRVAIEAAKERGN